MQIGNLNKILKPISSFLVAIMIVNSFMFAMLYSANPAQAQTVTTNPTALAQNSAFQAIKEAWNKTRDALTEAYRATQTAFDLWQKNENILAKISYQLMYISVTIMLQKMTQNIITWLDNDGEGELRLYDDFDEEFKKSFDLAGGAVVGRLLGLNNGELCNPNFLKVNLAIAIDELQKPTFKEEFKCSFSGGAKNLREFKENFESGGWESWVSFKRPENNDIANYIKVKKNLKKERLKKKKSLENDILVGNGLKAQKVCRVTKNIESLDDVNSALSEYGIDGIQGGQAGTFSLGTKLSDVMESYGYQNLEEFKIAFKKLGGDFVCKTETPASAIAELTSKVLSAPFEKLNKAAEDALSKIGPGANSIFKPYFDAISTSAINYLIRKEQGLFKSKPQKITKTRTPLRETMSSLKTASGDLYSSNNLLAASGDLRELLIKTILDFSVFVGSLQSITEKKDVLQERPLLLTQLTARDSVRNPLLSGAWLGNPRDPTSSNLSISQEEQIAASVKSAVENKKAGSFPTLPPAGTFKTAANLCGAFEQEIDSRSTNMPSPEISRNIGFIVLNDITTRVVERCGAFECTPRSYIDRVISGAGELYDGGNNDGWFSVGDRNVRIVAFNDTERTFEMEIPRSIRDDTSLIQRLREQILSRIDSTTVTMPWPDRFVRETDTNGDFIPEPDLTVTFIDSGYGYPIIPVGYPLDDVTAEEQSRMISTAELATINETDPRLYYVDPDPALSNIQGDIFYIKGNKYPGSVLSSVEEYIDYVDLDRYRDNLGGGRKNRTKLSPWKAVELPYDVENIRIAVTDSSEGAGCRLRYSGGAMIISMMSENKTRIGVRRPSQSMDINIPGGTVLEMSAAYADRSGGARTTCSLYATRADNSDINRIGIPVNTIDTKYKIKYFSPTFTNASMFIENGRKITMYDDFVDNNEDGIADEDQYPILNPFDENTKTLTIPQGAFVNQRDNVNPYKMTMGDFYEEINQSINKFLVKIRVLLGYPREDGKNTKTNLSGMADQIGSIPDDDPSYVSVSDVLLRYNNLIKLYQDLFSGMDNESVLEGIDPNFEILNATERGIVRALIGERCPVIPPEPGSRLYDGCPRLESTGEYTMAGRFVFKEDNVTGFATNPFTNARSSVMAGILNLNEMTNQLATLQPDQNIIKLIRLRQILEQLQVVDNPEPILPEGKAITDPDEIRDKFTAKKLVNSDRVLISLRNYPEIERYLNEIDASGWTQIASYEFSGPSGNRATNWLPIEAPNNITDLRIQTNGGDRGYCDIEGVGSATHRNFGPGSATSQFTADVPAGDTIRYRVGYRDRGGRSGNETCSIYARFAGNKPIDSLIQDYGFTSAKDAYPQISADLENVFPDIVVQVQNKLKEVFLKRTELALGEAKINAVNRLTDFVYFARDLSPAIQVQVPDNPALTRNIGNSTTRMKMGDTDSVIVRVISGDAAENIRDENGDNINILSAENNQNCMALTGEKLECGSEEHLLRGFRVVPWSGTIDPENDAYFKNVLEITTDTTGDPKTVEEDILSKIAIRKAIMAGIIEKIKAFNEFIGVNSGSVGFTTKRLAKYDLPLNQDGNIDLEEWDSRIEEGLRDVYIYYTGFYNTVFGVGDVPGREVVISSTVDEFGNVAEERITLTNDVKIMMRKITKDFSLLQELFGKIKEEFVSSNTSIISYGNNLKDLKQLFKVMESSYAGAAVCTANTGSAGGVSNLVRILLGASGYIEGTFSVVSGPIGELASAFTLGGYFSRKAKSKERKRGRKIAGRCSDAAKRYNNALIDVANKFICGG